MDDHAACVDSAPQAGLLERQRQTGRCAGYFICGYRLPLVFRRIQNALARLVDRLACCIHQEGARHRFSQRGHGGVCEHLFDGGKFPQRVGFAVLCHCVSFAGKPYCRRKTLL